MTSDEQTRLITEALQSTADRCAGLHVACVGDEIEALVGSEAAIAADFTEAKRLEFARGRSAARAAAVLAGGERLEIARLNTGLPIFPHGIVGSISHKHGWAVAVAGRSALTRSVGIDLEYDQERDEEDLLARVCTDAERPLVSRLLAAGLRSPATWIHCAKEAVYKARFAVNQLAFDYNDVELSLNEEEKTFQVVRIAGATDLAVHGLYARSDPWLVSLAIVAI